MRTDDIRPLTKSCRTWIYIKYDVMKKYCLKEKELNTSEFLR